MAGSLGLYVMVPSIRYDANEGLSAGTVQLDLPMASRRLLYY